MPPSREREAALDEVVAVRAIQQVLTSYARGVDRRDWRLVRDCYHDDAHDDHGTYVGHPDGFIEGMSRRHEHIEMSMHVLGNTHIDVDGDSARAETYCVAYQRFGGDATETLAMLGGDTGTAGAPQGDEPGCKWFFTVWCRYVDRFTCRDGAWRIQHRLVAYESVRVEQRPEQLPDNPRWTFGTRDRHDAVYSDPVTSG